MKLCQGSIISNGGKMSNVKDGEEEEEDEEKEEEEREEEKGLEEEESGRGKEGDCRRIFWADTFDE